MSLSYTADITIVTYKLTITLSLNRAMLWVLSIRIFNREMKRDLENKSDKQVTLVSTVIHLL